MATLPLSLYKQEFLRKSPGNSSGMLCCERKASLLSNFYLSCRVAAQLELDFNSVERIVEYLEVPQERPSIIENSRPPAYWPSSNGEIVVNNLVVRYASELPAVLKNLSFIIKPREKIGVVRWDDDTVCGIRLS